MLQQPINYDVPIANPMDSFLKGTQQGLALQQVQQQRMAAQQQAQQQVIMQQELTALSQNKNPSVQDYISIATKYPELSAKFKDLLTPLSENAKQQKISTLTQVLSAVKNGSPDVAKQILQQQADAARNSGDENSALAAETAIKNLDANPKGVADSIAIGLAGAVGADKFAPTLNTLLTLPGDVAKQEESISDSRLKRKLDLIDTQIKSENSDTKKQELQLKKDKALEKADQKNSSTQGALDSVSQQLASIDNILKNPTINEVGSRWYLSKAKGVAGFVGSNDAKDFEALVDAVKNQQFLSNLAALKASGGTLGQVTEAEGKRMENAIASLSTEQSPAAFKAAATAIGKSLKKIQDTIIASGKLPVSGAAGNTFVMKHSQFGDVTDAVINKTLEDNPGVTRQQVIDYFESTGGE